MNEMTIFEELRPETRSLTAAQVDALRAHVFDGTALVDQRAADSHEPVGDDAGNVRELPLSDFAERRRPHHTWLVGVAAAAVVALGVSGLWALNGSTSQDPGGPAQQPGSTAPPAAPPVAATPTWYSTIRPFLPDGMDQIALTQASPEVVGFKAFRTGTRQVLDISIVLQPGYGAKDTGETPTFTDDVGDYFESTSGLALITPDQRTITVSCGLSPLPGGAVGSVGIAGSERDYCGEGFDSLDLDAPARRALAARLATEFPAAVVTPSFGQPDRPAVEPAQTLDAVRAFVGDDRLLVAGEQWDGVLRLVNLSENPDGPSTTELTIVHGVWPPRAADGSPANGLDQPNPPRARFYSYDDLATAFVVADDGTGYSIVTSDTDQEHWDQLGLLLQQLVQPASTSTPATAPATSVLVPRVTVPPPATSELEAAMYAAGTVVVVNGSGVAGLGGSLTASLDASGYSALEPLNAATAVSESVVYLRPGTPAATAALLAPAISIDRAEELNSQQLPIESTEAITEADVIILLGADAADAPWSSASLPLVPYGTGVLLVLDATGTPQGAQQADDLTQSLQALGVDVDRGPTATRQLDDTMLMPIGDTTRWTFAVAELADIGGFDTWDPSLLDGQLPTDVTAILIVGAR